MRDRLVDAGFAAGWRAIRALPAPLATGAFRVAADAAARRDGAAARQLRRNLRRVVPDATPAELERLVRAGLRSYARYWLETFRLPRMDKRAVVAAVEALGSENLDAAFDAGRGYILALPHMGNWDVGGLWLVHRYRRPFTTVAERLEPASLFDRFVAYRQSLGMEVLALTGGASPPTDVLAARLRAGGGVCLVADRDLSRSGVAVDFFGEPTRMPGGPALLAARTGAALLPAGLWFTADGGWGQDIGPPIELRGERLAEQVRAGTQALADAFAVQIAAHPSDWHMVQTLWPADLPARTAQPVAAG